MIFKLVRQSTNFLFKIVFFLKRIARIELFMTYYLIGNPRSFEKVFKNS